MFAKISIRSDGLGRDDLDQVTREIEGQLKAAGGVELGSGLTKAAPGERGDPASFTMGTLLLAAVTSGTVTALFNILKSYVERGVDFTFEGKNGKGEPVKIGMKNVELSQFRSLLTDIGIVK
jgi:hypothetical protein